MGITMAQGSWSLLSFPLTPALSRRERGPEGALPGAQHDHDEHTL
jgi:hypothetical protein